ncbi:MAG: pseudouridine synthase, partial [Chloroflexota bacterium]
MSAQNEPGPLVRLQKLLADAGVASRRRAEELITQGRVTVNGTVVDHLGARADPKRDLVRVDGQPVQRHQLAWYMLNKPAGVVTTAYDPQHRPTVLKLLKDVPERVYPVGRLDRDSEGLLLLTNDGELAHRLAHPRYGVEKEYLAETARSVSQADLDRLRGGIVSLGETLRARRLESPPPAAQVTGLRVVLGEGKKREVRRMFEA